jgi:hypothetical protein
VLLMGIWGFPFFLDGLQALDHLEGEAHYAALLTLVLEVDGLVVVVDEHLGEKPTVVVESLGPPRDILVLHPSGLLAHEAIAPLLANSFTDEAVLTYEGADACDWLFDDPGGEAPFPLLASRGLAAS